MAQHEGLDTNQHVMLQWNPHSECYEYFDFRDDGGTDVYAYDSYREELAYAYSIWEDA